MTKFNFQFPFSILLSGLFFHFFNATAKPLGSLLTVEQGESRIEIEMLNDLWGSPYQSKNTPQKITQATVKIPFFDSSGLKMSLTLEAENRSLGVPDLTVGNNQVFIGPGLSSESFGFAMGKKNEDNSSFSLFVTQESASDQPFEHTRDVWTNFSGFYRSSPKESWGYLVGIYSSKNRSIWNGNTIPLLGATYHVNPRYQITVGFPFIVIDWSDNENLSASAVATAAGLLGTVSLKIDSDMTVQINGGVANRSYAHIARIEDNKRLFFEEKVIDIGFKLSLTKYTSYGFLVGYSTDRKIYEGEMAFNPIGPTRILNGDFFGGFKLEYIF